VESSWLIVKIWQISEVVMTHCDSLWFIVTHIDSQIRTHCEDTTNKWSLGYKSWLHCASYLQILLHCLQTMTQYDSCWLRRVGPLQIILENILDHSFEKQIPTSLIEIMDHANLRWVGAFYKSFWRMYQTILLNNRSQIHPREYFLEQYIYLVLFLWSYDFLPTVLLPFFKQHGR
jgi:hypothetical protein